MAFEKLRTPAELLAHRLGTALTMEKTVHDMLGELERAAQRGELKELLRDHAAETDAQIANLARAFVALDEEADGKPCPAIRGLAKQNTAVVKLAQGPLVDDVVLGGAAETEHYEIAVYEELITFAAAMNRHDIVAAMEQNLRQEQRMLDTVRRATQAIAADTLLPAGGGGGTRFPLNGRF